METNGPLMNPAQQGGPAMHAGMQPPNPDQEESAAGDSGDDQQIYETMVAGLTEYMFGKGKADIVSQLKQAKELTQTMGEITFSLVNEAVNQAKQKGIEIDMDILMGVASEVIDSLIRMVQALKIPAPGEQEMREQSLMVAVQSYVSTAKPGSEEQAAAQQLLSMMHNDGTTDAAAGQLQEMGQRAGVDPFADSQAPAEQAPAPQSAGLMGA